MDHDRIISDPETKGGKPLIKGTRVPVESVLEELALGKDIDAVATTFQVERADIIASLQFATKILHVYWETFLANPADIER